MAAVKMSLMSSIVLFAIMAECKKPTTERPVHDDAGKNDSEGLGTEIILAIVLSVIGVVVLLLIFVLWCVWRKKKTEAKQNLQLTKYYTDVKSQMGTSMYVFERNAWAEHLQALQQKEFETLTPYQPLHALLDDEENTLDFIRLKREAARLIAVNTSNAWRRGRKAATNEMAIRNEYLCNIQDKVGEAKYARDDGLLTIKGCRHEKLQNRKDSQVILTDPNYEPRCLHMSKLFDYYGRPIIICQGPIQPQFAAHWEAIWEETVGLVVWIGGLIEEGERKIDEYISMREGGKCTCGPFHLRTMMAAKIKGGYHAYRVQVKKEDKAREIVFIHVHMWPDHEIPKEPANLADLVWQIQGHQLRQADKGLPCVMMHCSLGVQRSPALVVVYIGRQMWLANRRVNILGILRYVRQHRWKAFSMGNPFAQVQIIHGVVQVIASRSQMEGLTPLVSNPQERRIFDPSVRRIDVQQAAKDTSLSVKLGA